MIRCTIHDFPDGSDTKASAYNAGDSGSIPGLGRSPGEGNGTPLRCSCLENPIDGGAWWATVLGVTKSRTRLRTSLHSLYMAGYLTLHQFFDQIFLYHLFLQWLVLSPSVVYNCDHMDCSPPGSTVHGDFPGKNNEVGCHALLQGIFPTQGLNSGLLHCRRILYRLNYQGSPSMT